MAVTSVSVVFTVWVLKLHHCGPHQAPMPVWLQRIVGRCGAARSLKSLTHQEAMKRHRNVMTTTASCQQRDSISNRSRIHRNAVDETRKYDFGSVSPPNRKWKAAGYERNVGGGLSAADGVEAFLNLVRHMTKATVHSSTESETVSRPGFRDYRQPVDSHAVRRLSAAKPSATRYANVDEFSTSSQRHNHTETNDVTAKNTTKWLSGNSRPTTRDVTANVAIYRRLALMEDTLRHLAAIMSRVECDDEDTEITADWRNLAAIADRWLFWTFLTVTVAYTGITMVLVPFYLQ